MIDQLLLSAGPAQQYGHIIGVIAPHAGYVYSGGTAAHSFRQLEGGDRKRFVIVGPIHSGYPWETCNYPSCSWVTPMGEAKIDASLARTLLDSDAGIESYEGHDDEHSIEVQVPWLQALFGDLMSLLPISMGDQGLKRVEKLASALLSVSNECVVIASSDLTHYEPGDSVERKDRLAMEAIESLDVTRFYRVLRDSLISACGYGPIATLMLLTKGLGGRIRRLNHSNSGDVTGDYSSVVGYPSMVAYLG